MLQKQLEFILCSSVLLDAISKSKLCWKVELLNYYTYIYTVLYITIFAYLEIRCIYNTQKLCINCVLILIKLIVNIKLKHLIRTMNFNQDDESLDDHFVVATTENCILI